MPSLARPSAVLAAVVAFFAPVLVLAQAADPAAASAGFGWVWIVAASAIVIALFWIVFSGRRGPTPPARRP